MSAERPSIAEVYAVVTATRSEMAAGFQRLDATVSTHSLQITQLQLADAKREGAMNLAAGTLRWVGFGGAISVVAALVLLSGVIK